MVQTSSNDVKDDVCFQHFRYWTWDHEFGSPVIYFSTMQLHVQIAMSSFKTSCVHPIIACSPPRLEPGSLCKLSKGKIKMLRQTSTGSGLVSLAYIIINLVYPLTHSLWCITLYAHSLQLQRSSSLSYTCTCNQLMSCPLHMYGIIGSFMCMPSAYGWMGWIQALL